MGKPQSTMTNIDDVEQDALIQQPDEETFGISTSSTDNDDSSELWVQEPSRFCWKCLLCVCRCMCRRHGGISRKRDIYRFNPVRQRQNDWNSFIGFVRCCWSSRTTDSNRVLGQPFTLQSDDETPANSTINGQEEIIAQLRFRISVLEQELEELKKGNQCPPTRIISGQEEMIAQLHLKISSFEHQFEELKKEKQLLLTRLSQMSSMQLTEGNPNIADLSDPNRPDKVAEQFSELYDNLWTDTYQVLCESRGQQEEKSINVLLKIILAVYEKCRSHADKQTRQIIKYMCMFTGVEVGESIIRESMHNLRNFRAKHFSSTMADIKKVIEESLPSMIGSEVYIDCQDYIAECTKVCWLMCIKSPPMYISAGKIDKFDHSLYTSYTKSGTRVSYVVWPTLFQYENGPIMKKGVAQGTN